MAKKLFVTKKLREIREKQGWTQPEFAAMLSLQTEQEISPSLYQKWEQGVMPIMPLAALELARLTKTDVKELVVSR